MADRIRNLAALSLVAIATGVVWCASATADGALAPLPSSDYTTRAVCAAPSAHRASCMAVELVPSTAAARAHTNAIGTARSAAEPNGQAAEGRFGLTPEDLHVAYQLPTAPASTQTIALVDAYNDPNAEADLDAYSKEFKLPECTESSGCFRRLNQSGHGALDELPFPQTVSDLEAARKSKNADEVHEAEEATGWGIEMSLDIDTAHAICESCHIVLVEANTPDDSNLEAAESTAAGLATEVSNSWGGAELGESEALESKSPFNHPGLVITASAGDDGYLNWDSREEFGYANFPASSPHVVAVGGTRLELNETTGAWRSETVWNGDGAGGGGCSEIFEAPSWQQEVADWSSVGCGALRSVADVSADADPYTGIAVYDSTPKAECEGTVKDPHWCPIGGTSLASPLIASVFALAGGAGGVNYPARTLYEHAKTFYENESVSPQSLHDVTTGSNAECRNGFDESDGLAECGTSEEAENSGCVGQARCLARVGYDGPSGVGTPDGLEAFEPTGSPEKTGGKGDKTGGEPTPGESKQDESSGQGSTTTTPPPPPVTTATTTAAVTAPSVQLSGLSLTLRAIVALNSAHPKLSQIGVTFTLNLNAPVRLTVAKRVRVDHRLRWQTLHSATTYASAGHDTWRLPGRGSLSRGVYRITLTATRTATKSLTFQIG
jgi:hypothetical protein